MLKRIIRRYKKILSAPLFGLALGVIFFYIGELPIQYASAIIALSFLVPFVVITHNENKIKRDRLSIFSHTVRTYSFVGRLSENGDFHTSQRVKFVKSGGPPISYIEKNTIKSFAKKYEVGKPRVITSSLPHAKIEERYNNIFTDKVNVDGSTDEYLCLDYAYEINPPLREDGAFIEYERDFNMEQALNNAFSDDGALGGVNIDTLNDSVNMTIIAPSKNRLEILDVLVVDYNGNRNEELTRKAKNAPPLITNNDSEINWHVLYPVINHQYLFRYRVRRND